MTINTIGLALTLVMITINGYLVIQCLKQIQKKQDFQTSKILLTMSLQDQILAALAGLGTELQAVATDAGVISQGIIGLQAQLAALLQNAGIDGAAILQQVQQLQTVADAVKTNLDIVVTALNSPVPGN